MADNGTSHRPLVPAAIQSTAKEKPAEKPPPLLAAQVLALDRSPVRVYPTGMGGLDALIGGGIPTRALSVVVARTGAGKTGYALTLARHITRTCGVPILYISTELDDDECCARIAALELHKPYSEILTGVIPRVIAREAVTGLHFHVVGCDQLEHGGAQALDLVQTSALAVSSLYGVPPLVVVDYLQMLADDDPRQIRMNVTTVARQLRGLSQRLDAAVLGVSSCARNFYRPHRGGDDEADDPLTYLAAAKESGDIEFAAANVIFLDVGDKHDDDGQVPGRAIVAKARRGVRGMVGTRHDGPVGGWTEHHASLGSMNGHARATRASKYEAAGDDERVLAVVLTHGPRAWRDLRAVTGVRGGRADQARARLLISGAIVEIDEPYLNARGQKCLRQVLQVAR
jgi:hypothetical protein